MVGWLLVCVTGVIDVLGFSVANAAHVGGLAADRHCWAPCSVSRTGVALILLIIAPCQPWRAKHGLPATDREADARTSWSACAAPWKPVAGPMAAALTAGAARTQPAGDDRLGAAKHLPESSARGLSTRDAKNANARGRGAPRGHVGAAAALGDGAGMAREHWRGRRPAQDAHQRWEATASPTRCRSARSSAAESRCSARPSSCATRARSTAFTATARPARASTRATATPASSAWRSATAASSARKSATTMPAPAANRTGARRTA
jgi:hypothetical protein